MQSKRVVIVGGGFGGLRTAFKLRKLAPLLEVLLIDGEDCFTFFPALYETAAGELHESAICFAHAHSLERRGVKFFHDKITAINWKAGFLSTLRGERLEFDYLVLALGAQTNYYGIPGMAENAFSLKTKEDAERLEEHLSEVFHSRKPARFIVCGGGLTGVEYSAALADHCRRKCREKGLPPDCYRITLVHSHGHLLPEVPASASFAENYLRSLGIELVLDSPVVRVDKGKVVVKGGRPLKGDVIVWTGGIKTHEVVEKSGLQLLAGEGGRAMAGGGVAVNQFLQTLSSPKVFAVGDCAAPVDAAAGKPAVKTAINAYLQAGVAARNIAALEEGNPLSPYKPEANPLMFTLGRRMGVLTYKGILLKGWWVAWLKGFVEKVFVKELW